MIEVVLITDENEIALAREKVDHVRDDRLTLYFDQWLGNSVPGPTEALTKPGHGNNYLHEVSSM